VNCGRCRREGQRLLQAGMACMFWNRGQSAQISARV
jgi:hypothetical protein